MVELLKGLEEILRVEVWAHFWEIAAKQSALEEMEGGGNMALVTRLTWSHPGERPSRTALPGG